MKRISFLVVTFFIAQYLRAQTTPIALHLENPHYFIYHGKPTILITSGEHYGALLNLDFDYFSYLDELKSKELNLTRTFTGSYVEPNGAFNIAHNTLAPAFGRFICPWARSTQLGYSNGGNKFDLTHWDTAYFNRLKDFAFAAQKRDIVIELSLFCPFYEEVQWKLSPMNAINNINGVGAVGRNDVYTLNKNNGLLKVQEAMVRKIVDELKDFDNIIYEICNEPYFGGVTMEWQHHIASVISEAERNLQKHHLISQNIANASARIENPRPDVSVFNFHYASPPVAVAENFNLSKVIGDNETGFRGTSDSTYRMEGWEFVLAGGGLYNNLDYSFTADEEKGTFVYPPTQPGGGSPALRRQLSYLKNFIYRFDFVHMHPDSTVITGRLSRKARAHVLSEQGKQYAVYVFGDAKVNLELMLPPGTYYAEWMNPVTGNSEKQETLHHLGGKIIITSPNYKPDIALRIVNTASGTK